MMIYTSTNRNSNDDDDNDDNGDDDNDVKSDGDEKNYRIKCIYWSYYRLISFTSLCSSHFSF